MGSGLLFKISSFNIRCYGLGGEYSGRFGDEKRNDKISQILKEHLSSCDVMVFQEIIDVEAFRKLVPTNYYTVTYPHDYKRHQHIVMCYQEKYKLRDIMNTNYMIKGVELNAKTSRPAMYGLLVENKSQKPLVHIIGVHLKSGATHTQDRLNQIKVIMGFIKLLDPKIPVILVGDFNTQLKAYTQLDEDDVEQIKSCLDEVSFKKMNNEKSTYRTPWESHSLDHFWVSESIYNEKPVWVYDLERNSNHQDLPQTLKSYYREVSDHLPVVAEWEL